MNLQLLDFYQISHVTDYKKFQNKNVVITGATGFIGGYITKYFMFLNDKYDINIDIYLSVRNIEKAQSIFGNRDDIFFVYKYSFDFPVDYIFHCASNATPVKNETDITGVINTNINMTRQLLEVATEKRAKLLFVSAGEVYGANKGNPLHEWNYNGIDPTITRNNYGLSKLVGENLCYNYTKKYGTQAYVARLFHTYGIGINLNDPRIFGTIVRHIIENKAIHLKSVGAIRSFCYISDVLIGIFTILDKGNTGEPYNIGGKPVNVVKLTQEIASCYDISVTMDESIIDTSVFIADCFELERLGWHPTVDVIEGFKHTIDYYRGL
jgi:nucleoside-diphosphate-sugar epimerase